MTSQVPSGAMASAFTVSVWPWAAARIAPVAVSHSRTVRSTPTVANQVPSGASATFVASASMTRRRPEGGRAVVADNRSRTPVLFTMVAGVYRRAAISFRRRAVGLGRAGGVGDGLVVGLGRGQVGG